MNTTVIAIPKWIYVYSGFLILTAMLGGYAGYVDPYVFFGILSLMVSTCKNFLTVF